MIRELPMTIEPQSKVLNLGTKLTETKLQILLH